MDRDGRVSIVGRAKDLIISGGFNVYPKEIEDALDALARRVIESAVIGVPHPDFGEVRGGRRDGEGTIGRAKRTMIAELARRLARFKLPKRIHRHRRTAAQCHGQGAEGRIAPALCRHLWRVRRLGQFNGISVVPLLR